MTIRTVIFDAYGTLFDVAAAARVAAAELPRLAPLWPRLAEDWRRKQLEYSWLRTILRQHADFWQVTGEALDWALEAAGLADEPGLRARLMQLYKVLPCYPEVPAALAALRARGLPRAILTNGSPTMIAAAVAASGLRGQFDALLSVEQVGIYKPAPVVYDLVLERFAAHPGQVLFVSSNGWDVAGAAAFGFRTLWVNRAGLPVDRLPQRPAHIAPDLTRVTDFLA